MLPRTALIQIQRSMYDKLKEHASSMFGGLSPQLKQYFQQYQDRMNIHQYLIHVQHVQDYSHKAKS